jgi:tRNA A37 methylthiotransferase MiaB
MNRYSNIEKIRNAFARIRAIGPDLKINTHCIVGFPSESMAEFKETLAFITDYHLSGYIYFFSERPNTRALSLESKISDKEKIVRLKFARKYLKKNDYQVLFLSSKKFFMFDPGNNKRISPGIIEKIKIGFH